MKLRRLRYHVALLSIAFLLPLSLAHASFVLMEDAFDTENGGRSSLAYDDFENWNVVSGDVDLRKGEPDTPNGLYVDLDGDPGRPGGRIETIQTFDPGTYELEFDLAGGRLGSPNDLVTVFFGPSYREIFGPLTPLSAFSTVARTVTISPGDTGRLVFDHTAHAPVGDGGGPYLNNVKISMIPEPSSLILGTLALPFIWVRRKVRS